MLRILILFLCSLKFAFCVDYFVLEKEYFYENNEVYAKDLFPNAPHNFFLLKIPQSSNNYQVKSSNIVANFENEGIIVGAKEPIIVFKKKFIGEYESIKKHILGEFLREYQKNKIQINRISLEQITPINFKEEQIKEIDFHKKLLKRNEGSFDVVINEEANNKIRERKVYFKYKIDATLQAISTTEAISGRTSVDYSNARLINIPFSKISAALMMESELGQVAVRSYTPKDVIITHDRLILKRVVKKGDKVSVLLKEDGVVLEFVLIAQKDAAIGDVISAKELEGKKTHKIEILGEGKGKLL